MLVVDTDPLAETMGQQQYKRHSNDAHSHMKQLSRSILRAHRSAYPTSTPTVPLMWWIPLPRFAHAYR